MNQKIAIRTPHGRILNAHRGIRREPEYYSSGVALPLNVDLEAKDTPIRNQMNEGCCVMFATAGAIDFLQVNDSESHKLKYDHSQFIQTSTNYGYGKARQIDGDFNQDQGTYLHTGALVASDIGFVSERVFPYGPGTLYKIPSHELDSWAQKHRVKEKIPVQQTRQAIQARLSMNRPVTFGLSVYDVYENVNSVDGKMEMPESSSQYYGGHANCLMGYIFDTSTGTFWYKTRNSWDVLWGVRGYAYLPEFFVLNPSYCSDFWSF